MKLRDLPDVSFAERAPALIESNIIGTVEGLLQRKLARADPLRLILLGVAAIIPAILDLFGAVKGRAGWRRIVMASLLLIGLAGMAWWAWSGNALSWDISI